MNESDGTLGWIDEIHRAAIRDVDAEANAWLIRDHAIALVEALIGSFRTIDHSNAAPVDLLRGDERHRAQAIGHAHFAMDAVEPPQGLRLIMPDFDSGHAERETMNDAAEANECRKDFRRKFIFLHCSECARWNASSSSWWF